MGIGHLVFRTVFAVYHHHIIVDEVGGDCEGEVFCNLPVQTIVPVYTWTRIFLVVLEIVLEEHELGGICKVVVHVHLDVYLQLGTELESERLVGSSGIQSFLLFFRRRLQVGVLFFCFHSVLGPQCRIGDNDETSGDRREVHGEPFCRGVVNTYSQVGVGRRKELGLEHTGIFPELNLVLIREFVQHWKFIRSCTVSSFVTVRNSRSLVIPSSCKLGLEVEVGREIHILHLFCLITPLALKIDAVVAGLKQRL